MKVRSLTLTIGIAVGLFAGSAVAEGVNDKMREMFGAKVNVTTPGVAKGTMSGVVTGGGVSIRAPIKQVSNIGFDPPSISAGCGGIDMYGGNLSFPSKEQFIATGRAIVGNIGGYAFKAALKSGCDLCESVMSSVQETVNMLNFDNMNSCQLAAGIVDGDLGTNLANNARSAGASWAKTAGKVTDTFSGFAAGSGKSPVKDAVKDPAFQQMFQGNVIWNAMHKTNAFDWLGTSKSVREEIMSLIGTVIVCVPGEGGCKAHEGSDGDLVFTELRPSVTLADFVALDSDFKTKDGQTANELKIYLCRDEDCLNPNTNHNRALGQSWAQVLVEQLLGKDGQPGLLLETVTDAREVQSTLNEHTNINLANSGSISADALNCYRAGDRGRGDADYIIVAMAPQIQAENMHTGFQQAISDLIRDISENSKLAGAVQATQMLERAKTSLDSQMRDIRLKTSGGNDQLGEAIRRCGGTPAALHAMGGLG